MAVFGAPLDDPRAAHHAVAAPPGPDRAGLVGDLAVRGYEGKVRVWRLG